jgi:glycerophosphoryl diester phosphodiesterase
MEMRPVKGIAHRGYSRRAPENTLISFEMAFQKGFRHVECDVEWTKDGVPVLLHDETIDRTARNKDGSGISGPVRIGDISYQEACSFDYGIWRGSDFAGNGLPSFEDFMGFCHDRKLHPYIELKGEISIERALVLKDIVQRHSMLRQATWISFHALSLRRIQAIDGESRVGCLGTIGPALLDEASRLKSRSGTVFIDSFHEAITTESMSEARGLGLDVEAWTVNDISRIEALAGMGVSGITSDLINAAEIP